MVGNGEETTPAPYSGEAASDDEHGGDGPEDRYSEIASILATGYLRLLLVIGRDTASPDVCATCGPDESALGEHEGLEVPERKSVHVSRD